MTLWNQECINDLWDAGCKNDKLHLLALGNQSASVAIKTSEGITKRFNISNAIMQGTVNSGLFCTCSMDKLAKLVYGDKSLIYNYKGVAEVPPLEMVDDVLTITKCSLTSVTMNATVNAFIENKKLQLSQEKCSVIHVGKLHKNCHELKIHGKKMHQADTTKYLGDTINKNAKVASNMAERRVKAVASFSIIRAILEDIPLGTYRVEIGLELRQALFINSVLFNCETWHGVKDTDFTQINIIDNQILRYICKSHAKTPTEFLFLETGATPILKIISIRRMNYLHEILNREENELVRRVFSAQVENPSKGDFIQLVEEDFKMIGEEIDFESICQMTKIQFKKHIKEKVKLVTFNDLQDIQKGHSKVRDIQYSKLNIQEYLQSPKFSDAEKELLFALRSHTKRGIKSNFPSFYAGNLICPLNCHETKPEDCQNHILNCNRILAHLSMTDNEIVQYSDIYGSLAQQKAAVRVFSRALDIREELLKKDTQSAIPTSGASLDTASRACQGSSGDL